MERATARVLQDGRLHLAHGPIDTLVSVDPVASRAAAFEAATVRFQSILTELVAELPQLRTEGGANDALVGKVAQQMAAAVRPFQAAGVFVTPMAAVAGAVAYEVLAAILAAPSPAPARVMVNNGGDIAIHLGEGERAKARIASPSGETLGLVDLRAGDGVGGIATSGRHGRSLSLGIADSVTILAKTAAVADAAATLVANAVDLPGHQAVTRVDAETLDPDSDLRGRVVTTAVGQLSEAEVGAALDAGATAAEAMRGAGLLAAALFLKGRWRTVGLPGIIGAPAAILEGS
ncbi:MAG: UPF0280 family protein [Pseudomonadota bacterium]